MMSRVRRHFSWANIAMTVALVFAMSGGALAAKHYVLNSIQQVNPKVLKQLQGKQGAGGATGAQGSPGAAGAKGDQGPKGDQGEKGEIGEKGEKGEKGSNGLSVTNAALSKGNANCKEGGAELKVGAGSPTYACTGEKGEKGEKGEPWTVGGLPKGASEVGEWNVSQFINKGLEEGGEETAGTAISFNVPLKAAVAAGQVHFIQPGGIVPTGCSGTVEKPEAAEGNLCIFASILSKFVEFFPPAGSIAGGEGADQYGAQLIFLAEKGGEFHGAGTWVVTGG
jgi:hypothetical protein